MRYDKFKEIHVIQILQGFLAWRYGTADNIEIFDMLVKEKRKGYGTQLVRILLEELKETQPQLLFGFTKKNNVVAQCFYSSLGFKLTSEMGDNLLFWQNYKNLYEKIKQTKY